MHELYQSFEYAEELGKDILLPDYSSQALYLSSYGELFCYSGMYLNDKDNVNFKSWPYFLKNKHSTEYDKLIKGLFRIKNGCILLTSFVDQQNYSHLSFKRLENYIIHLPTVNSTYFGIDRRRGDEVSWSFEEHVELSRKCFGLCYSELEYFIEFYAQTLGIYNSYIQYPRITRSLKSDNFCDLTGLWIPAGFPYIAFNESGYDFGHVSLFGFYRYVKAMTSMGANTALVQLFKNNTRAHEILNQISQIDDYFPFEIMVTREYIVPEMYVK